MILRVLSRRGELVYYVADATGWTWHVDHLGGLLLAGPGGDRRHSIAPGRWHRAIVEAIPTGAGPLREMRPL